MFKSIFLLLVILQFSILGVNGQENIKLFSFRLMHSNGIPIKDATVRLCIGDSTINYNISDDKGEFIISYSYASIDPDFLKLKIITDKILGSRNVEDTISINLSDVSLTKDFYHKNIIVRLLNHHFLTDNEYQEYCIENEIMPMRQNIKAIDVNR